MTTNSGFWEDGLEGTADRLNASLAQYDTLANRPVHGQQGRLYICSDGTNAGRMFRDTGTGWTEVLLADGATSLGTLWSLGTGSTQAAAGDHTHAQTAVTLVATTTGSQVTSDDWNAGDDDEKTFSAFAVDTASASNAISLNWNPWATQEFGTDYGYTMDVTIKIYYNSSLVQTITGVSTANTLASHGSIRTYARMPASASSHNFQFKMQPESAIGSGTLIIYGRIMYNVNELQATI